MPAQKVRWQKARLREAEFIRLHTDGLTYEQIGDLYGITKQAVSVAINRGLQRVRYEAVDEWRRSLLARLEGQYDLLVPAMEQGDVKAHEAGVRILGEIAKVVGAYAPTRTEVTGKDGGPIRTEDAGLSDDERAGRIAALLDRARARRDGQSAGDGVLAAGAPEPTPTSR